MKTKICKKCLIEKEISQFDKAKTGIFYVRGDCKDCRKIYGVKYRQNSEVRDRASKRSRAFYLRNKDKVLKRGKIRYLNNKEKILKRNREYRLKKYNTDENFRMRINLSVRVNKAIKRNTKSLPTVKLLGCSIQELKKYLESQFQEGMSWDNYRYDGWHIDHIIPCDKFDLSKEEEQKKCFHYTNLQPLWKKDNMKKSNDIKEKNYGGAI